MTRMRQASEARHKFTDVVDGAVGGEAQFVKRRDGRQVVVVSPEYFEKTQPCLKTYLLNKGTSNQSEDAFDRAMHDLRSDGSPFIKPAAGDISE